jgi:plastocyanin
VRLPRRFIPLLVIAIIAAVIGFAGVRTFGNGNVAASGCDVDVCVLLTAEGAKPDIIALKAGGFVQFNSADGKKHSLSLGSGGSEHSHSGPFSSGNFDGDEAWKVQFKEKGTFQFHDHYNPELNVLVVVYEPGGDHTIR